jgi:hypothetical protein
MVNITDKQLYLYLTLLDDEVDRYESWLRNKDYVSEDERKLMVDELLSLKNTIDDLNSKKIRRLTLVD